MRAELLTERRGKKVEFLVPQRGDKLRLLEMAMENARQSFASRRDNESTREKMLDELRAKLHLRNTPKRIECYDISNLQGTMVVGSQATFDEGEPRKDLYRRYRIRTVEGQDDFASMYEVLSRRLKRALAEKEYPDLWVIDGGKGQLNVALRGAEGIQSARSDRSRLARQAARPQRRARSRRGQVRRARVHSQSQGPDRPAAKLHRAVPAGAHPRRGPSFRDHLQSRAAPARAAALGPRRYRGHRPGEVGAHCCATSAACGGFARRRRRNWRRSRASMRELAAEIRRHLDLMSALLDQEEKVEREEDRVAAEYLDAGNGQLQLLARKAKAPASESAASESATSAESGASQESAASEESAASMQSVTAEEASPPNATAQNADADPSIDLPTPAESAAATEPAQRTDDSSDT